MKFLSSVIVFILIFLINSHPIKAIYDPTTVPNNKFGIHILYPEEILLAAKLVNTSGGDWGYVTIPIQATDRNLEKWQKFMDDAKSLHIIPIIRLTTYPINDYWVKPDPFESTDFANFLNSLSWPVKNRYVIIFNEVNRAQEWGGELNPEDYARYLDESIDIFKSKCEDFFVLNAGFDAAAPNNHILMDEYTYLNRMEEAVPGIFSKLDGWNSHSYPNPGFSSLPSENRRNTISGFKWELKYLERNFGVKNKPVFITETGWRSDVVTENYIGRYYEIAFNNTWKDKSLVAVTPFLLSAGTDPFKYFSFTDSSGNPSPVFNKFTSLKKSPGNPIFPVYDYKIRQSPLVEAGIAFTPSDEPPASPVIPQILEDIFKLIFYQD